ncbi:MAG TPA: hypothetical protein VFW94_11275 [Candidatus Acidoferrales bacterium]|nr:hypothetical protein [Candidatus Acidoferrales bacterium]
MATSQCARAQTQGPLPIQVNSDLVVVPVVALNTKQLSDNSLADPPCVEKIVASFRALSAATPFLPEVCDPGAVLGLTPQDFQVLDDGVEQTIGSVTIEPIPETIVRDNLGDHFDWSFATNGVWSSSDSQLGSELVRWSGVQYYSLTYTPRVQGGRDCHSIKVKIHRSHALVLAPFEYCYAAPSDPLNGSKLGERMGHGLTASEAGKIPLSLQVSFFFTDANRAGLHIALAFPGKALRRSWDLAWHAGAFDTLNAKIGVLGMIRRKDGAIATRFSDFGCCSGERPEFLVTSDPQPNDELHPLAELMALPTRYETQVDLPPGEYELQIVLSDGSKFGRVETPIVIDPYDGKELALSSIAICRRLRYASAAIPEARSVNLAPQYVPLISKGMVFTPSGDTTFSLKELQKEQFLYVYYEVYDSLLKSAPATTVQVRMRIINTTAKMLETDTGFRSAADWMRAGDSTIHVSQQIAVDKLQKGTYQIQVQAKDSAGGSTAWRTATFTVK